MLNIECVFVQKTEGFEPRCGTVLVYFEDAALPAGSSKLYRHIYPGGKRILGGLYINQPNHSPNQPNQPLTNHTYTAQNHNPIGR